jgi:hypothetical protein
MPRLDGPAGYAFAHGLSVILSSVRDGLYNAPNSGNDQALDSFLQILSYYHGFQYILEALASVCGRACFSVDLLLAHLTNLHSGY